MAQYSGHYLFDVLSEQDKQKFKFNYETAQAEYNELNFGVIVKPKEPIPFEQFLDEVYHTFS